MQPMLRAPARQMAPWTPGPAIGPQTGGPMAPWTPPPMPTPTPPPLSPGYPTPPALPGTSLTPPGIPGPVTPPPTMPVGGWPTFGNDAIMGTPSMPGGGMTGGWAQNAQVGGIGAVGPGGPIAPPPGPQPGSYQWLLANGPAIAAGLPIAPYNPNITPTRPKRPVNPAPAVPPGWAQMGSGGLATMRPIGVDSGQPGMAQAGDVTGGSPRAQPLPPMLGGVSRPRKRLY